MTLLYVLLAILLLGILIAVHEFGHFIAARITGIPVKEFSIGFGPKVAQWKSKKHETVFTLRPIPMGGYCMFYGDTEDDPKGEMKDDPRNYNNAAVWKRMLSVASGPLMNFVLAFVVAVVLMAAYGGEAAQPYIQSVTENAPAAQVGFQAGDVFVKVGDISATEGDSQALINAIQASEGKPVVIKVLRNGQEMEMTVTPALDEASGKYLIGIVISATGPLPLSQILPGAWDCCVEASGAILNALGKLVTTGEGFNDAAGPVGVVQIVAQQTQEYGLVVFLNLMVIISINLGLVNLMPIPGMDGSRLIFMLIEAIRRKPVSQRIESAIHLSGYVLLMGLMLFFTFRDVGRLFGA